MKAMLSRYALSGLVLGLLSSPAFAADAAQGSMSERMERMEKMVEELEKTKTEGMEELKSHVETLEQELTMVDYRTGRIKALQEKVEALSIGGDLSLIVQGVSGGGTNKADGSYSADLFLIAPVGRYGNLFFRGDIGQGEGASLLIPPTFSGPNADLEFDQPSFEIAEAWYWTEFAIPDTRDKRLEMTIGKMDPTALFDANTVANSEVSQFMADIFVNNLAIEFGGDANGYGAGLSAAYRFTSIYNKGLNVTGRVGLFEGDGDFQDMMDSPFIMAELDIWRPYYGLDGNYRIYAWTNQVKHTDLADPTTENLSNKGFGISVDQKVSNDMTLFARYGVQDKSVASFDQVISAGAQLVGNAWGRGNDVAGLAYGASHVSKDFKDNSLSLEGYSADASFEHYIEAYYRYWANDNISISPDLQVVVNPGGDSSQDTVFIYGARLAATF
ncbi:MAG: hypothetical protein A2V21_306500 [Deltaproteobacteria bacterium GWC2_55_46]|nr:MAG: hypothetical protein A2Z79_00595 [Deltaproteobacteria bacterium GWA2_55_82]OGQ64878.1 MAG: hypothetical protein A3I81_04700 [Deltaproteobacteria bacterium RIFCSPLOWO2_02_FULL_55_12]OIJ73945.1 MAG: hypothetical protein A2V21_306500 [Deltaproteobacteria bacterium GWC2_55_46]